MQTTYKNPLWKKGYGPVEYTTDAVPEEYRGYLIYKRNDPDTGIPVWDAVKDGACVKQMAGPNGAKRAVDELVGGAA